MDKNWKWIEHNFFSRNNQKFRLAVAVGFCKYLTVQLILFELKINLKHRLRFPLQRQIEKDVEGEQFSCMYTVDGKGR